MIKKDSKSLKDRASGLQRKIDMEIKRIKVNLQIILLEPLLIRAY